MCVCYYCCQHPCIHKLVDISALFEWVVFVKMLIVLGICKLRFVFS